MRTKPPKLSGVRVACDSIVALATATSDGSVLFAKNSDRPAREAQPLVQIPHGRHPAGAKVRCQYVEIDQVGATARAIGSRPYWLWGFEHGVNEHGVAIGNHTVFTKDELSGLGLIGMDLVRLGLERGTSAAHAVEVIAALVEQYGQGGSGYADKTWPYHNSFTVADGSAAYLLETSDRRWAVRRIREFGSASNHLTIGEDWDGISAGAIEHAIDHGWWSEEEGRRFDFATAYRDTSVAPEVVSSGRHKRSCELLGERRGRLTAADFRAIMRDHYEGGPIHRPGRAPDDERYYALCMHAEPVGTTTASMVARLGPEGAPRVYWGCLGSPCVGVFLPYYVEGELPEVLGRGGADPSSDSPWWQFEHLLELTARDFARHAPRVRRVWDEFELDVEARRAVVEQRVQHEGATVLTRFMADNAHSMRETLTALIRELA